MSLPLLADLNYIQLFKLTWAFHLWAHFFWYISIVYPFLEPINQNFGPLVIQIGIFFNCGDNYFDLFLLFIHFWSQLTKLLVNWSSKLEFFLTLDYFFQLKRKKLISKWKIIIKILIIKFGFFTIERNWFRNGKNE